MLNLEDDEDDLFFTPQTSSNLASLFNNHVMKTPPDQNVSLIYRAPKQPGVSATTSEPKYTSEGIQTENRQKTKPQSSVIAFKEVHAFQCLPDGQYNPTGKCGFALIGNEGIKLFQLLIYKQKDNILSSSKINPAFNYYIQKNNYVSLVDDKNVKWAIQFNNELEFNEFTSTLITKCICRIVPKTDEGLDEPESSKTVRKEHSNEIEHSIDTVIKHENEENQSKETTVEIESDGRKSILERVAKMGQKILVENEDNLDVEECKINQSSPKKHPESPKNISLKQIMSKSQKRGETHEQFVNSQASIGNYSGPYMYPSASTAFSDPLHMFFIENRTHNSECRMSLMKLSSGIQEILELVKNGSEGDGKKNIDKLAGENKKYYQIINKQKGTITQLNATIELHKKRNDDLMRLEADHSGRIASLTEEAAKATYEDHKRGVKLKELEQQIKEQNRKISESEESYQTLYKKVNECNFIKKAQAKDLHDNIKEMMNNFYEEASTRFKTDEQYDHNLIRKTLAPITVDYTYKILKLLDENYVDIKDDFK